MNHLLKLFLLTTILIALSIIQLVAQNDFNQSILERHNHWRSNKGVQPLKWSNALEASAIDWANTLARQCDMRHSDGNYGENLFMGTKGYYGPVDAVDSWMSEEEFYDERTNSCEKNKVCGHYTQVIWSTTTDLGCARVDCDDYVIIVCQYSPPGNIVGQGPFSKPSPYLSQQTNSEDIKKDVQPMESESSFVETALARHNYWRRQVNVPELVWSSTLEASAARWVEQLAVDGCNFTHSQSEYGENLFMGTKGFFNVSDIIDSWASESKYYDPHTNECEKNQVCGHYTQMIWSTTREVGCAQITCGDDVIFVCQYNPPGNWVGESPFSGTSSGYNDIRDYKNEDDIPPNELDNDKARAIEDNTPRINSKAEERQFYWDLSRECCPDAYAILQYDPDEDFTRWVDVHTEKGLVDAFSTVVHETTHHVDHKFSAWEESAYIIDRKIIVKVPEIAVVNSNELNRFLPASRRTGMMYYELYIGDKSDMGSQLSGIYGILEEFNAYYHGLKAEIQMKQKDTPYSINENIISGELESYYSFNLFISWYLQMIEQQYPEHFQKTMDNRNLRVAYTLIENNYSALAQEILNDPVLSKGYSIDMRKRITRQDQTMLDQFKLPGVNKANFQQYLKE